MKKYWLSLFPDTFLWIKNGEGFIYNTRNFQGFCFKNTGIVACKTHILEDIDSLYRVEVNDTELDQIEVKSFVDQILQTESGRLVVDDGILKCPVSMKPELRIQDDVDYYRWEHEQHIDGNIVHNLHQLVFYLNGSESGSMGYYKQILFPLVTARELEVDKVENFIKTGYISGLLSEICLIGNIWKYPDYLHLLNYLEKIGKRIIVYGVDYDMLSHFEDIKKWEESIVFNIWVKDSDHCGELLAGLKGCKNVNYNFTVSSVEEYDQIEGLITRFGLQNIAIHPIYTGDNLAFFEEQLFLGKDEIDAIQLSKRDIYIRQTLNVYSFGRLYVMPDGNVYANPVDKKIGTINESLHDLIYREMTAGESWFKIRDQKPCCDCVYQWLCPSPSNYEKIMGKVKLCTLNK